MTVYDAERFYFYMVTDEEFRMQVVAAESAATRTELCRRRGLDFDRDDLAEATDRFLSQMAPGGALKDNIDDRETRNAIADAALRHLDAVRSRVALVYGPDAFFAADGVADA